MTVYDPENLLVVHATVHAQYERDARARLHGHHPLHLGVMDSMRRARRRVYIHYQLRTHSVRHGVLVHASA